MLLRQKRPVLPREQRSIESRRQQLRARVRYILHVKWMLARLRCICSISTTDVSSRQQVPHGVSSTWMQTRWIRQQLLVAVLYGGQLHFRYVHFAVLLSALVYNPTSELQMIIIRHKRSVASGELREYSTGQKTAFTRSAVNAQKVNQFACNLEHHEHIVESWPWQILGAIRTVATVWEAGEILFLSGK